MKPSRVLSTFLLFALLLAALAYPAASAREHKDDGAAGRADEHESRGKGPPRNESAEPRSAGKIVQSNPSGFEGRYTSFSFDASSCEITDYRVHNVSILASIQLPAPCEGRGKGGASGQHGSSFHIGGKDVHVRIHDAPNGLVHFEADENNSIQISAADGVAFDESEGGFSFAIDNLTGLLRMENGGGEPTTITGKARIWVHPISGGSAERVEIREAIKERKIAGEIDVLIDDGAVTSEVLTYEEVILRAQRNANGSFRFLVDANLTSGRTFVVNLGPGVFENERVGLRYWDLDETSLATEVAITEADSLDDVLEITEGEGPEYWITHDKAGKHVLVAVPEFSAHVFEIASVPAEVVPVIIWGMIGGAAFVGMGAVGMFRRRTLG